MERNRWKALYVVRGRILKVEIKKYIASAIYGFNARVVSVDALEGIELAEAMVDFLEPMLERAEYWPVTSNARSDTFPLVISSRCWASVPLVPTASPPPTLPPDNGLKGKSIYSSFHSAEGE